MALYMIIERNREGAAQKIYSRLADRGRMMPIGLRYIDSWVTEDLGKCFQVIECDDRELVDQWISAWDDLVDFEVIPVISSSEAQSRAK